MASNQAFQKQAESASDAARRYMEENEKLQEVMLSLTHVPVVISFISHHNIKLYYNPFVLGVDSLNDAQHLCMLHLS